MTDTRTATTRTALPLRPRDMETSVLESTAEVPVWMLPAGTRFCLRIPAAWGYPESREYGEVVFTNASRARVLMLGKPRTIEFGERVFESMGTYECNLPLDCQVEPIAWNGDSGVSH